MKGVYCTSSAVHDARHDVAPLEQAFDGGNANQNQHRSAAEGLPLNVMTVTRSRLPE
jgi:hypothetical protein